MIAMSISNKPKILIADEATTSLDVTVQKKIIELLKSLNESLEMAIIFISHDLPLVASIADRMVVMQSGIIKEKISVNDHLAHKASDPYTKALINCRPRLDKRMKKLPLLEDFQNGKNGEDQLDQFLFTKQDLEKRKKWLKEQEDLLIVENLSCGYSKEKNFFGGVKSYLKAVDNISFSIKAGSVTGLVGESGSGKSTLAHTLVGLKKSMSGKILYDNLDVLQLDEKGFKQYRKEVQLVFQNPYSSLNPRIKVGEAIGFGMQAHGLFKNQKERKEKVLELLNEVGLKSEHYERYPNEFSGGQRQRICIAKALAVEPKFIICDECVSSLDVSIQAQILNLLLDLKERHKLSYLFISHDLAVVKFMSDNIIVMDQGKIVEQGPADDVYHATKNDYTKKLIDAIPSPL